MFKAFQKGQQFKSFPNLNFQVNNEAYGFSGCTFWMDAAYGTNTQTNLAAVSRWVDKIRSIPFEQATAGNQPRYVVNDANFNNYPTVDFYDLNRWLTVGSGQSAQMGPSTTVAWVARMNALNNSGASSFNQIMGQISLSTNKGYNLGGNLSTLTGIGFGDENNVFKQTTVEDTVTHIVVISFDNCVIDGTQRTYTVTGSPTLNFTCQQIGSGRSLTSQSMNGQIGEILVYAEKLSLTDMIDLSTRLNSKYAIY